MLMLRRKVHGNLRGSMHSTRFVRGMRHYNVLYIASSRLDSEKFVECERLISTKLNFRFNVAFIESACSISICSRMKQTRHDRIKLKKSRES